MNAAGSGTAAGCIFGDAKTVLAANVWCTALRGGGVDLPGASSNAQLYGGRLKKDPGVRTACSVPPVPVAVHWPVARTSGPPAAIAPYTVLVAPVSNPSPNRSIDGL